MNVLTALSLAIFFGGVGGLYDAFKNYTGAFLPQVITADVEKAKDGQDDQEGKKDPKAPKQQVTMWIPGFLGQVVLGSLAAVIALLTTIRPLMTFDLNMIVKPSLSFTDVALFFAAGALSTVTLSNYIDTKARKRLALTSTTEETVVTQTSESSDGAAHKSLGLDQAQLFALTEESPAKVITHSVTRTVRATPAYATAGPIWRQYLAASKKSSES